jgi:hypothetical protein
MQAAEVDQHYLVLLVAALADLVVEGVDQTLMQTFHLQQLPFLEHQILEVVVAVV